jgi:2,4-dienoyl-CoA reductase-like NADH-dependent reductase (Old Yellow Enzyme family)
MPNTTKATTTLKASELTAPLATLFTPAKILGISSPNRIMASPTKVENQADTDGTVTPALIRHYTTLARQGIGTILVESAYVARQGRMHRTQLGISEEQHLEGLQQLVKRVRQEGAAIGIRLSHAGAKTSAELSGEYPVAPSEINFGRDFDISREFDEGDCEEIILHFIHAAERAEEVGMDFVEINGGDQLLLDQCLSVKFNKREDGYGPDSIPNRMRLATEIVQGIRNRESVHIPIAYYFSVMDKVEDGFTPKDLAAIIRVLEKSGVNILHPITVHALNHCFERKKTLIEWTARTFKGPQIMDGSIKSPQLLQEAGELKIADWYVMDRSLLARPQWFAFLKRKLITEQS